jgi:hypothetical protein
VAVADPKPSLVERLFDAFIVFLRTLKGVRVEVTATQIRVSQQ